MIRVLRGHNEGYLSFFFLLNLKHVVYIFFSSKFWFDIFF